MEIKIKNRTNLKELKLKRNIKVELSKNSEVQDLIKKLSLERLIEEDGSISSLVLIQKNKKTIRSVNEKLNDGDKIKIMPTAAGG